MKEIEELAKKLGYKIIYNQESECEPLYNDSSTAGDTIWIGEYDCKEFELISFFHEHGHSLISKNFIKKSHYNTLLIEIEAWNCGIKFAMSLGYYFSDEAIKWAYSKKVMSYVGHDSRECSNWENNYKPLLWIHK